MKMTGVSLFPSPPARGGTAGDVGQCSAGLLSDLDKGTESRSDLHFNIAYPSSWDMFLYYM